jgi:hypothetical protein
MEVNGHPHILVMLPQGERPRQDDRWAQESIWMAAKTNMLSLPLETELHSFNSLYLLSYYETPTKIELENTDNYLESSKNECVSLEITSHLMYHTA